MSDQNFPQGEEEILKKIEILEKRQDDSMQEILYIMLEDACKVTGSKLSYFAIISQDEQVLTMIGWSKSAMTGCKMIVKPMVYILEDTGLWGDAVRERKTVITNDYKSLIKPTKKGYPPGHVDVEKHMNVPLFEGGRIVALCGVGNSDLDYTDGHAKALTVYLNKAWKILKPKIVEWFVSKRSELNNYIF